MSGEYSRFDRDLQAIPYRHISGPLFKFMVVEMRSREAEQARREVPQAHEQFHTHRREKQNNRRR